MLSSHCLSRTGIVTTPQSTPRQDAADALHCAFILNLIAETKAKIAEELATSDSGSDSSSSSSSSFDSDDIPAASDAYLHHMAELYSHCYWEERGKINKDGSQLQLLLHDWKYN